MPPNLPLLAKHLDHPELKYVLVGGLAVVLHGGTRVTLDADLAIAFNADNRKLIVDALAPLNPRPMRLADGAAWEWDEKCVRSPWTIYSTDAGRVDLLIRIPGVPDGFEGLFRRSELREWDGIRIRLASIDDLLAMKGEADREKDREDERQLLAIRRLQKEESL